MSFRRAKSTQGNTDADGAREAGRAVRGGRSVCTSISRRSPTTHCGGKRRGGEHSCRQDKKIQRTSKPAHMIIPSASRPFGCATCARLNRTGRRIMPTPRLLVSPLDHCRCCLA